MHAITIAQVVLHKACPHIHSARRKCLLLATRAPLYAPSHTLSRDRVDSCRKIAQQRCAKRLHRR